MGANRWIWRLVLALAVVETAWLAYPTIRVRLLAFEVTPAARGQRLARELGCFGCHGAGGNGGTANPGSEEGTVPAFTERTQMMYVKTSDDLREYVLDGAPRRKRDDPDYRAKVEATALHMPAYRNFVSAGQLEDLVAYLRAASGQILPEEDVPAHDAETAARLGCFSCHGPLGAGGLANPGSFKGYVPAFWGADFDDLVHDDDELRAWIAKGELARIVEHPIGGRFLRNQTVKMPAYERFVPAADIDALVAYVRWIRSGTWSPAAAK